MTNEEKSVLEVIAYFGQWQRALTVPEITSFLFKSTLSEDVVAATVNDLCNQQKIVADSQYVGLSSSSIQNTHNRQILLNQLRQRSLTIASKIHNISGVESVILMNSVAMQTCHKNSDIDLLIITRPNTLYTTRAKVLFKLKTHKLHKTRQSSAGQSCLGYWLTLGDLNVKKFRYNERTFAYWVATMVPLIGISGYQQFIKTNKDVQQLLPNWQAHQVAHLPEKKISQTFPNQPSRIEQILYQISKNKIMRDVEFANSNEAVCTLNTLKLHSVDSRPSYIAKMQSILDILSDKR